MTQLKLNLVLSYKEHHDYKELVEDENVDQVTVEETTELMDETLVEESYEMTGMIAVEGLNLKPGMAMDVEMNMRMIYTILIHVNID